MSKLTDESIKWLADEGLIATGRGGRPGYIAFRVPTVTVDDGVRRFWMPYDLNKVWVEWSEEDFFEHFEHFLVEPCVHCGAPIGPDGRGHEDGCAYADGQDEGDARP
jgi:hypothetical protein